MESKIVSEMVVNTYPMVKRHCLKCSHMHTVLDTPMNGDKEYHCALKFDARKELIDREQETVWLSCLGRQDSPKHGNKFEAAYNEFWLPHECPIMLDLLMLKEKEEEKRGRKR